MFGFIQVENIREVSYNSPGVHDVWLLIYKFIRIYMKKKFHTERIY